MTKHEQKIKIGFLLLASLLLMLGLLVQTGKKTSPEKTTFQQLGDKAYLALLRPEDSAPIQETQINPGSAFKLPILMYHHVGTLPENGNRTREGLTVSKENFEAQVKWLKNRGYQTVSLQNFYDYLNKQNSAWPDKPVIITFDDGYSDAFEVATPILIENRMTATFAIITSFPGLTQGDNSYATWEQIASASYFGMEIICHTQNHFDGGNKKYTTDYIYKNLVGCQHEIENHLGSSRPFLVYPYGHYTSAYVEQAKKAGFAIGLTVHQGSTINLEDLMRIPRLRVSGNMDMETFKKMLP